MLESLATTTPSVRPKRPEPCDDCRAAEEAYWAWCSSHCQECSAELTGNALEAVNYGSEPRCDVCSDRRYYATSQGKLELAQERVVELEKRERELKAAAAVQSRAAAEQLAGVEAQLKDAIAALAAQIGPRSHFSPLSDS